jgi:acetoin utilization protein AcuB
MEVGSIMTKKVVTVELDDDLQTIIHIFQNVRFHHLLVVEDGKLVGVISDRDVLKVSSPFLNTVCETLRDSAVLKKKAHQIMTRKPVTISSGSSLEEAVRLLLRKNVSCLPVLSSSGTVEGIVTWKDLIKTYMGEKQQEDARLGKRKSEIGQA